MNKFTSFLKLLTFLLWHDKKCRPSFKYILLTTIGLICALWSFPLDNLYMTGVMPPEEQRIIREIGTYLVSFTGLVLLMILVFKRYQKYKQSHKLTDEELNNFLNYMNENS